MLDMNESFALLDKAVARAQEQLARDSLLPSAELFLCWRGGSNSSAIVPRWSLDFFTATEERLTLSLYRRSSQSNSRSLSSHSPVELSQEFTRWCLPIDRGMKPSSEAYASLVSSGAVLLGPLASLRERRRDEEEEKERIQAARSILTPKVAELLLLSLSRTWLRAVDLEAKARAERACAEKLAEFSAHSILVRDAVKLAKSLQASGEPGWKAEVQKITAQLAKQDEERKRVCAGAASAGEHWIPLIPFEFETLEELGVKLDLLG